MTTIVSLCDRTQNVLVPWRNAGFNCLSVDIEDCFRGNNITHIKCNVMDFDAPNDTAIVLSMPPCTHLASSGARWFASKGDIAYSEAISLVRRCIAIAGKSPHVLENPVGRITRELGPPNEYVHPFWFAGLSGNPAESYTKKTGLWCFNGAISPTWNDRSIIDGVPIDDKRIHHASSGIPRQTTPIGLATAIYLKNRHLVSL